ncbi:uncharacterized protein TNCV_2051611 [Trichonephila clavipes]|nr:uncharacterized protein TNCV_2051611 [Trichonephila clavipes]
MCINPPCFVLLHRLIIPTVQFPHVRHHSKRRRQWVGFKGSSRNGHRDPKCPSARRLNMVREDTEGPLLQVLSGPGCRPINQLTVHVHFLRCDGLLDDWSVEGVLNLVFMTATAGSDVVQCGHPIFDYFFQPLRLYIGNNTANVVFQMVKRLLLTRIDQ